MLLVFLLAFSLDLYQPSIIFKFLICFLQIVQLSLLLGQGLFQFLVFSIKLLVVEVQRGRFGWFWSFLILDHLFWGLLIVLIWFFRHILGCLLVILVRLFGHILGCLLVIFVRFLGHILWSFLIIFIWLLMSLFLALQGLKVLISLCFFEFLFLGSFSFLLFLRWSSLCISLLFGLSRFLNGFLLSLLLSF